MKLISILTLFLIFSACNGDYSHNLPNNYSLVRIHSGATVIANDSSKIIIGPSKYGILVGVRDNYIFGNLDTEEKAYNVDNVPDRYFIIDTEIGEVFSELTEKQFTNKMKELKITNYQLFRPNKLGLQP